MRSKGTATLNARASEMQALNQIMQYAANPIKIK